MAQVAFSWNYTLSANGLPVVAGVNGATTLQDGVYNLTLSYQDAVGNPPQSTSVVGITIDSVTIGPAAADVAAPTAGASYRTVPVTVALPEPMSFVRLSLASVPAGSLVTLFLQATDTAVAAVLQPKNLTNSSGVLNSSAVSLADGLYTVTLTVRHAHSRHCGALTAGSDAAPRSDRVGNAAVSRVLGNVTVDTVTRNLTLSSPLAVRGALLAILARRSRGARRTRTSTALSCSLTRSARPR